MNTENIKQNIAAALATLPNADFLAAARGLLETLGYHSELTPDLRGSVTEVVDALGLAKKHTKAAQNLSDNVRSAGFIFQVGADEIDTNGQQTLDWETASFERGHTQRFNFVAVELRGTSYARGQYAEFTREINAWFNAPTVILFKTTDNRLTLAFVHRRQHKHDPNRDVLGSVSLIREINPTRPHRAHVDTLAALSLDTLLAWMSSHNRPYNFDGLLAAWLDTLNTEALNKRFYTELFDWFEWAVAEATFPTQEHKVLPPQEHVIRLITRLLFVWFLKEKGLVADDLFNETKIAALLNNYDRDSGDSYYRAVLQNLFFATLNTEMDRRGFSTTKHSTHRNFSRYRYQAAINDPDALLGLFAQTPFINGGLFDCLDSEEGIREGGYRIDCFSDNARHYTKLSLPNRLFFDEQRGLFPLLNHYKFTVEENTPIEQEVALDPELLGKVFENLLAAYNPETQATARKQTGSYYTPRPVVDYMVDEALKHYLTQKVTQTLLSAPDLSAPEQRVTQTLLSAPEQPASHKEQQTGTSATQYQLTQTRRRLPHWKKDDSIYWITFRLADAIPQDKLRAWQEERDLWLNRHPKPWSEEVWNEYNQRFDEKMEAWLDAGMGSRALARPDAREAVKNCLLRFDGERFRLHAAVIMPTHVHLLMEPFTGHDLSRILQGIKGVSAREINKLLGVTGTFWLDESYDHIVRSEKQYWRLVRYIADNPTKAGLRTDEYWHYQNYEGGADTPEGGADTLVCVGEEEGEKEEENREGEEKEEGQTGMSAPQYQKGGADTLVCVGEEENREEGQTGMSATQLLAQRVERLLSYHTGDGQADFTEEEADALVRAIADLTVLDPAVGSGAFPMGVLHKLTLALGRIDPDNTRWQALQKERARQRTDAAFETKDQQERDAELLAISDTFEKYSGDFGRKLYLIQNSIFGVDIQPIACQIAKLRFFISLAIEQEPDKTANNFGIKPLPNLETRFIAADTLLTLRGERMLTSKKAQSLERQLLENRERHFHATTRRKKLEYKKKDKRLREELAKALESIGFPADDANKIAQWDPYDQNAKADWFDAEYMFGNRDGVDVVIGNPPYVQLQKDGGKLGRLYKDAGFETFARTGDIYQLFYERGCQLLTPSSGLLAYITSNSWLRAEYGKATRRYFAERHTPLRLLEMGKDVFANAIVDTSVLIARSGTSDEIGKAVDLDRLSDTGAHHYSPLPPDENQWGELRPNGAMPWSILSPVEQSIMDKMEAVGTPLKEWDVTINYGIKTGYNDAFVIDDATRQALIAEDPNSAEIIKPILRGRDIQRYQAQWAELWLIDSHNGYGDVPAVDINDYPAVKTHLDGFYPQLKKRQDKGMTPYNLRNCAYHEDFAKEKLFWMDMSNKGRFAYSDSEMYCNNKGFVMTGESLKYLCALLNSALITWLIKNTARTTGVGLTQWEKFAVERLPIPQITTAKQRPFVRLVDSILEAKDADPAADTEEMEVEIDRLVCGLYGLTEGEVGVMEGRG